LRAFHAKLCHNSAMSKIQRILRQIFWGLYFFIFFLLNLYNIADFFSPESAHHLYFQILYLFDTRLILNYILTFIQINLTLIHLIGLALFIHRTPLFNQKTWQYLFLLRIVFDIVGHPYGVQYLISLYHQSPSICLSAFIFICSFYVPSYIASYHYAFKDGIFNKSSNT
jgi:hypothetical protein